MLRIEGGKTTLTHQQSCEKELCESVNELFELTVTLLRCGIQLVIRESLFHRLESWQRNNWIDSEGKQQSLARLLRSLAAIEIILRSRANRLIDCYASIYSFHLVDWCVKSTAGWWQTRSVVKSQGEVH